MINSEPKKCKNKKCPNPVLNGKYCEHCTQIRKEKRDKVVAIAGSAVLAVGGIALKAMLSKSSNESDN